MGAGENRVGGGGGGGKVLKCGECIFFVYYEGIFL